MDLNASQRMKNVLKPTIAFGKGSEKAPSSLLFNMLPLITYNVGFSHDWRIWYDDKMDKYTIRMMDFTRKMK